MTRKLCTFAGCREIVEHADDGTSPRCAKHKTSDKAPRKRYEHHYDERGRNIYDTPEWKRIRKAKRILNPVCEVCEKYGMSNPTQIVDHIIEIEDGGEPFDINNTQSLCTMHHNKKTGREKALRNNRKKTHPSLNDFK